MMAKSSFLIGAEMVLRQRKTPMTAHDIWFFGCKDGIFSEKRRGETPEQTLKSKLSVHIRRYGADSLFVRTSPGRFYLRDLLGESQTIYDAPPWRPPPSSERVVVFHSSALEYVGRFQGIIDPQARISDAMLCSENLETMDRRVAELDEEHKQVLVYVLVRRPGEVLAYRRGTYSLTDRMLVGADCVGFGGHVNDGDRDLFSEEPVGLFRAVCRELLEELSMPTADRERLGLGRGVSIIGYLNDDSSSVGRRHFAVIMEYWVANPGEWDRPAPGEESTTKLRWLNIDKGVSNAEQFEYWSQLVLRKFLPNMLRRESSFRIARRRPLAPPHRLVVVGQVGSGKTEACSLLRDEFGYREVKTGVLMAQLLGVPPIPETPRVAFQRAAARYIVRVDGVERLARAVEREVEAADDERVLVDGVRQIATLDRLREFFRKKGLGVLYVSAPPDVAFRFYRSREDRSAQIMDFLNVWDGPGEEEVPALLTRADAVVYNWFGRKRYLETLRRLMADLGIEPSDDVQRRNTEINVGLM